MVLDVVQSYTDKPGARYKYQGRFSGEEFRDEILYPKFMEAIENGEELIGNLDGGYGYGSSFLEEAFGGLARDTKDKRVLSIKIISDEEPKLIHDITNYMKDALRN